MPLELLDGAWLAVRRAGSAPLLRALAAGAPLALLVIALYYFERVEGIASLRVPFALLLVLGYGWRALQLSAAARTYALAIRPSLPLAEQESRPVDVCCTAGVAGIGLWVWLWLLALFALASPWAVAGALPLLALRGAVAPSWLARSRCARERGLAAFGRAFDDTSGLRGAFLIVELLALFGSIGLFANLYALVSFSLMLADSLLGFDVAFMSTFLSPDNTFVLLLVAAATLLLFEPLRAAISAQAFVTARTRRDGADLHAAVDRVIAAGRTPRRAPAAAPPSAGAAALLLLMGGALGSPARADDRQESAADAFTRQQVEQILSGAEFREFAERESDPLSDWLERLFRSLDDVGGTESNRAEPTPERKGTISPFAIMAIALVALCLLAVYVASQRTLARPMHASEAAGAAELPRARAPSSLLDEAAMLAARGDPSAALRALYLACLIALDRGRLIEFDAHKTNGQYLRAMAAGPLRDGFAGFTRVFDRTFYGHADASPADYAACRALAEQILGSVERDRRGPA